MCGTHWTNHWIMVALCTDIGFLLTDITAWKVSIYGFFSGPYLDSFHAVEIFLGFLIINWYGIFDIDEMLSSKLCRKTSYSVSLKRIPLNCILKTDCSFPSVSSSRQIWAKTNLYWSCIFLVKLKILILKMNFVLWNDFK